MHYAGLIHSGRTRADNQSRSVRLQATADSGIRPDALSGGVGQVNCAF
jgi:hypothetical protein